VAFHRVVPVKSNGLFELEQSLFRDDDGVVDHGRDVQHPHSDKEEAKKHAELGEIAYIAQRAARVRAEFSTHIKTYMLHTYNRFSAMAWFHIPQLAWEEEYLWTAITRVLFALPLIVFVSSLWSPRPLTSHQVDTIVLFVSYLVPYLLVSYYSRYMIPAMGIRCLLLLWGVERWLIALRPRP
jgi:hypothetical protein